MCDGCGYVFSVSPYLTCLITSFISGWLKSSTPKYLSTTKRKGGQDRRGMKCKKGEEGGREREGEGGGRETEEGGRGRREGEGGGREREEFK